MADAKDEKERSPIEIDFGSEPFPDDGAGDEAGGGGYDPTVNMGNGQVAETSDWRADGGLAVDLVDEGDATNVSEDRNHDGGGLDGPGLEDFTGLTVVLQDQSSEEPKAEEEVTPPLPPARDLDEQVAAELAATRFVGHDAEMPTANVAPAIMLDFGGSDEDQTDGLQRAVDATEASVPGGGESLKLDLGAPHQPAPDVPAMPAPGGGFNLEDAAFASPPAPPSELTESSADAMFAPGELSLLAAQHPTEAPPVPHSESSGVQSQVSGASAGDYPPESMVQAELTSVAGSEAGAGPKTKLRGKRLGGGPNATFLLLAVAMVVMVGGYLMFGDQIGTFLAENLGGETSEETPAVAGQPPPPGAGGAKTPAAAPPGVNQPRYEAIDRVLVSGNPMDAIREFKVKLEAPVHPTEQIVVAALKARYYMLVSRAKKAADVLAPHCAKLSKENLPQCVHYVRALITTRDYRTARQLLDSVRVTAAAEAPAQTADAVGFAPGEEVAHAAVPTGKPFGEDRTLNLLDISLNALGNPTFDTASALLEQVLSEFNVDAEWYRQRGVWFARSVISLAPKDRARIIQHLFGRKRKNLTHSLDNAAQAGLLGADPMLVPFLNFLASRHGIQPLEIQAPAKRFDTDQTMMSYVFDILERTNRQVINTESGSSNALLGRETFSDFVRLLSLHSAIRDDDWNSAYQVYASFAGGKRKLEYEWLVAGGLLLSHFEAKRDAKALLRQLEVFAERNPGVNGYFTHWALISSLRRVARVPNDKALLRADSLAVGRHERAVVAVERAETLAAEGKLQKAAELLLREVSMNKHDPYLVRQARRMIERVGGDPNRHLPQVRFSERDFFRSYAVPVMSDFTVRTLLEAL